MYLEIEFSETISHLLKQQTIVLDSTYEDVIKSVNYKISATVGDNTYEENRIITVYELSVFEEGEFTTYADVTQEQMLEWVYSKLNLQEIESMKNNILRRVHFHSLVPTQL